MIKPFRVHTDEWMLDDLKRRLINTRWTDEVSNSGWSNGTSLPYMKELVSYWAGGYNWRKTESEINALPNFMAGIDGYDIHFIHVKGKGRKSIPLLITHGWPGSFLEMLKLIPLLTADACLSFDLVIPSVVGFGFSQRVSEPGCNSWLIVDLWKKLMAELGYEKFGVQGGDIGAGISTRLALKYPEHITGVHLNFISGSYAPYLAKGESLTEGEEDYKKIVLDWSDEEGAYGHLQRTRPATLSFGLNDSPAGLCAWIIEKFRRWSDCNGNPESIFTRDELLSNITLYWITQTISSAVRLYREDRLIPLKFGIDEFVKPPVAVARFPRELPMPPRSYVERGFNVQQWTEMSFGGHFAAMEQPVLLAEDIIKFFGKIV